MLPKLTVKILKQLVKYVSFSLFVLINFLRNNLSTIPLELKKFFKHIKKLGIDDHKVKVYLLLLVQVCVKRVMLKHKTTPWYINLYVYIYIYIPYINKYFKEILFNVMQFPISHHNEIVSYFKISERKYENVTKKEWKNFDFHWKLKNIVWT